MQQCCTYMHMHMHMHVEEGANTNEPTHACEIQEDILYS